MSRKHDARGRSAGGPPFIQLYRWMLDSPAWRSLSVYSRCLYIALRGRYFGNNNGNINLSYREAEIEVGCSNRPIIAALKELQEKGFIRPQQKGSFSWKARVDDKGTLRATTWILTELPQDFPAKHLSPTKEFMSWQPTEKKTRGAVSMPLGCAEHAIAEDMGCAEHANGVTTACHSGPEQASDGVLRACTYSLPSTSPAFPPTEPNAYSKAKGRAA